MFISHGDIVNIKFSVLMIFPQTEQLVNLAVINLLELAGGADVAEHECRRKLFGLLFPSLATLPNELVKYGSLVSGPKLHSNDALLPTQASVWYEQGSSSQVSNNKYGMSS